VASDKNMERLSRLNKEVDGQYYPRLFGVILCGIVAIGSVGFVATSYVFTPLYAKKPPKTAPAWKPQPLL
jgi:preprotein translocase subunit Sss1